MLFHSTTKFPDVASAEMFLFKVGCSILPASPRALRALDHTEHGGTATVGARSVIVAILKVCVLCALCCTFQMVLIEIKLNEDTEILCRIT